ncbi:MAG: hypothetical protein AAFR64_11215 [Pseudomonadota bacterium]
MIRAEPRNPLGELIRRLRIKGEHMATHHAQTVHSQRQSIAPNWRDATHLWPDFFED